MREASFCLGEECGIRRELDSCDDIDESWEYNQKCPFCEENRAELGGNWIVATKKEKLQPNLQSCNEIAKVATKPLNTMNLSVNLFTSQETLLQ